MRRTSLFIAAVIVGVLIAVVLAGPASAAATGVIPSEGNDAFDWLVVLVLLAVPVVPLLALRLLPGRGPADPVEAGLRQLARRNPRR